MTAGNHNKANDDTLLLIDGNGVAIRCYKKQKHDAPDLDEAKVVQNAMKIALQSVRKALMDNPTTHALVAFDAGGHTWRHQLFDQYKANRESSSPELKAGLAELREKIEGILGVKCVAVPGVEADDTITTVCRRWIESGRSAASIIVACMDKDMTWLLSRGVRIWHHFDKRWITADDVRERYEVEPSQILDYLALAGDKTDGIPGLHGCGHKTAVDWLTRWGSIAGIIAHADEVKGKIGEKLRASFDVVRLSRRLTALGSNVQTGLTWKTLERQ